MTKRVITKLPDACSFKTGERIKCNSRIYEKKKSGRWATVIIKMVDRCKVQVSSIKSYYQDVFNLLGLEENGANRI